MVEALKKLYVDLQSACEHCIFQPCTQENLQRFHEECSRAIDEANAIFVPYEIKAILDYELIETSIEGGVRFIDIHTGRYVDIQERIRKAIT